MQHHVRRLSTFVLAVAIVAAQTAAAAPLVSAKSLACGGTGPQAGSLSASMRNGLLTIKGKGQGLTPGEAVACGYTCGQVFTSGPQLNCGTVGTNGKWSGRVDLSVPPVCFGFIPFFLTPTTGKCVASVVQ
jgi:hypothetical protein